MSFVRAEYRHKKQEFSDAVIALKKADFNIQKKLFMQIYDRYSANAYKVNYYRGSGDGNFNPVDPIRKFDEFFDGAPDNFNDEVVGTAGTDIAFVDAATLHDGECIIIDEWQDHKNVLRLQDDATGGEDPTVTHNITQATSGTHEFWIGTEDRAKGYLFSLYEGATEIINVGINNGSIWFEDDGAVWRQVYVIQNDTWYHIKYVWRADNTCDVYINNIKVINNISTTNNQSSGVDSFILTAEEDSTVYHYLDAYGETENVDYTEGDNWLKTTEANWYYGTYDFREEYIGASGTDIGFVDSATLFNGALEIVSDWQSHNKVLRLQDDATGGENPNFDHTITQATSGTHEFWIGTNDVTEEWRLNFREVGVGSIVTLRITASKFQYYARGGPWTDCGQAAVNNIWYHCRVVWYVDNTFDFYVNGSILQDGVATEVDQVSGIDSFQMVAYGDSTDYCYIDAYGEVEDDDYTVGDNLNKYGLTSDVSDFIDTYVNGYECHVGIISSLGGHNNVLDLFDNSSSFQVNINDVFSSVQEEGTIELWIRSDDVSDGNMFRLQESDGTQVIRFRTAVASWQAYYGSAWTTIATALDATWYHIRVYFYDDGGTTKFSIWINGVQVVIDETAQSNGDIRKFNIISISGSSAYHIYIDAIAYSWDSDFDQGIEAGLADQPIFEGRVIDHDESRIQTVWLENPANELDNIRPTGDYSGRSDQIISSLITDWFNYISEGTLATGGAMGTLTFAGDKTMRTILDEFADHDFFTWSLSPTGVLDYNSGNVDMDVILHIWHNPRVSRAFRVNAIHPNRDTNKIIVYGAIVNSSQKSGEWNDLEEQQITGIILFKYSDASLNTNALCTTRAEALGSREGANPTQIEFWLFACNGKGVITYGLLQVGQRIQVDIDNGDIEKSPDNYIIDVCEYDGISKILHIIATNGLVFG